MRSYVLPSVGIVLLVLLGLGGCGFKLRGSASTLSPKFKQTYLYANLAKQDYFHRQISQLIVANKGQIVDKQTAVIAIKASPITSSSRQIALSGNGAIKEYEYRFIASITIIDLSSGVQLGSRVLSTKQNIQRDTRRILDDNEQLTVAKKNAARNLAQSVIRYLQSF